MGTNKDSDTRLTRCRCGRKIKYEGSAYGRCPRRRKADDLSVYHDAVAQSFPAKCRIWLIRPEGGRFRPYTAGSPGPDLFDTEDDAWRELEQVYWGWKRWPDRRHTQALAA